MKLYAHICKDNHISKTQTLQDHLNNVALLSFDFAKKCGLNSEHAYQIGMYHDIGKSSVEFQNYLLNDSNVRVIHSDAGGFTLFNKRDGIGAFCIFGHHTGIPNLGSQVEQESSLLGRINRFKNNTLHFQNEKLNLFDAKSFSYEKLRHINKTDNFDLMLETRMYFSCLVDSDWQDSSVSVEKFPTDSWDIIYDRFFNETKKIFDNAQKNTTNEKSKLINKWRTEIFNDCRTVGQTGTEKIYSLSAPTGSGKTFASMAFALERVKRDKLDRIIYCIPYTSIIQQNAKEYENVLGNKNVVEVHSLAEYDIKENEEYSISLESYKSWMVDNWDIPVVLTTNVQFFESLLSNRTKKTRKLHNIANSVIILDEAQMLPREFFTPCKELLKLLVEQYNCTVVLCTATQPALTIGEENNEILSNVNLMYERFKRLDAEFLQINNNQDTCSEDELADKLLSDLENGKSVLCVVNKKKTAQNLYNILSTKSNGKFSCYHLSLFMCSKHRDIVLNEIKSKLGRETICLISTSLVEAGVDLSFDIGYRELTGLDRLVQSAGRVNRHGTNINGKLYVFCLNGEKYSKIEQIEAFRLLSENNDVFSQDVIKLYFNSVYSYHSEYDFDTKNIMEMSKNLQFVDIGRIHFIEDSGVSIIIPYNDEAISLIDKLKYGLLNLKDYRKLHKFIVDISFKQINEMLKFEALDVTEDGFYILNDINGWYNPFYGLIDSFQSSAMLL